jgi:hypothetical protein
VGDSNYKIRERSRQTAGACGSQQKATAENKDEVIADLQSRAAHAHTAAAYSHSTGDHASDRELANEALVASTDAVKYLEQIAKETPQAIEA